MFENFIEQILQSMSKAELLVVQAKIRDLIAIDFGYSLNNTEIVLLSHGDKLAAIKSYRTRTGCGLKEAKDAIEKFQAGDQK